MDKRPWQQYGNRQPSASKTSTSDNDTAFNDEVFNGKKTRTKLAIKPQTSRTSIKSSRKPKKEKNKIAGK